jgi:hypothetical protein
MRYAPFSRKTALPRSTPPGAAPQREVGVIVVTE